MDTTYKASEGWLQTRHKIKLYPLDPRPEDICIEDIAFSLARQHRFGGHSDMTVAQHSVLVSRYCDRKDALWGLLHDVPEYALGDVPRPIKYQPEFAKYRQIEENFMAVVCFKFNLHPVQPESVTRADRMVLAAEARDLMAPFVDEWKDLGPAIDKKIIPWGKRRAENEFLRRFHQLTKTRANSRTVEQVASY